MGQNTHCLKNLLHLSGAVSRVGKKFLMDKVGNWPFVQSGAMNQMSKQGMTKDTKSALVGTVWRGRFGSVSYGITPCSLSWCSHHSWSQSEFGMNRLLCGDFQEGITFLFPKNRWMGATARHLLRPVYDCARRKRRRCGMRAAAYACGGLLRMHRSADTGENIFDSALMSPQ